MNIKKNISLKPYNTFGIDVTAKEFIEVDTLDDLKDVTKQYNNFFVLGGGSNLLLTKDLKIPVVKINLKGITIISENDDVVLIKANAGENWHHFVLWCLNHNYGGLENLSLIPGNVGTAPMQNIGAYGVEIKDTLFQLEAFEINTGFIKKFSNSNCNFGYRNSIFKNKKKGKYIITSVIFKLTKKEHTINTSYGAIKSELDKKNIKTPTIKDVSDAVIAIRQSKLPDPKEIGNSGSFFKNPVISIKQFNELKKQYPEIPSYPVSYNEVKVPAGWLVEQCGFKGKRFGDAGIHKKQALVLVNYGNATGKEIFELAKKIQQTVFDNFGVKIELEVNII